MSRQEAVSPLPQEPVLIDRRTFVGALAAVSAVSLLPSASHAVGAFGPAGAASPLLSDWTIDDMWGVYPRYADPIAYGRPATDVDVAVDPIDAQLVA